MKRQFDSTARSRARCVLTCLVLLLAFPGQAQQAQQTQQAQQARQTRPAEPAQRAGNDKLAQAAGVLRAFGANEDQSIPAALLNRAHGVAVIPNVLRGGFIFGARRGRGVLVVRTPSGEWSNPAFITLTGGSIGWQIGAESADVVLVFANEQSVRNIQSGKFTLGGNATAIAGPLGQRATAAVTFRAEVYTYVRSQGLFAGAAFEGARLAVDDKANAAFYEIDAARHAHALGEQNESTPAGARRFLLALEQAALVDGPPAKPGKGVSRTDRSEGAEDAEGAVTYPLQ